VPQVPASLPGAADRLPPARGSKSAPRATFASAKAAAGLLAAAAARTAPAPPFAGASPGALPPGPAAAGPEPSRRWSLAGYVHARRGGSPDLAAGGSLGGSQAGARLAYRLAGPRDAPLSLVGRVSAPFAGRGAEAAIGIEWQPRRGLPLRLAAERRQALAAGGRSALSVGVHGGVSDARAIAGFRIDAYGQAGLVGLRARDPFVDGQLRILRPAGRNGGLRLGAGIWAAAQPGVGRVDMGPSASLRIAPARTTLILDWRHRAAGNARPGSGPALTVWTDF
jgi:hypothetical protein